MIANYEKIYQKELERVKRALFTAKSVREIRALRNRIKFLQKMMNKKSKKTKKSS